MTIPAEQIEAMLAEFEQQPTINSPIADSIFVTGTTSQHEAVLYAQLAHNYFVKRLRDLLAAAKQEEQREQVEK